MRSVTRRGLALLGLAFAAALWCHAADARTNRWVLVNENKGRYLNAYSADEPHAQLQDSILFSELYALGVDGAGNLHVFGQFASDGQAMITFPPRSQTPSGQFRLKGDPTAIAVAPDGTLYLAGNNVIYVYPPDSKMATRKIRIVDDDYGVGPITVMHVDPRTGILYFTMLRSTYKEQYENVFWVKPGDALAYSIFYLRGGSAGSIATDSKGRVIVSAVRGVSVYCPRPWHRCGFLGAGTRPQGLAYDIETDRLYVGNGLNNDVDVYHYGAGQRIWKIETGFAPKQITLSPVLP